MTSENDKNKALRRAAREYSEAWADYRNEERKARAVKDLEDAARAFAAADELSDREFWEAEFGSHGIAFDDPELGFAAVMEPQPGESLCVQIEDLRPPKSHDEQVENTLLRALERSKVAADDAVAAAMLEDARRDVELALAYALERFQHHGGGDEEAGLDLAVAVWDLLPDSMRGVRPRANR